MLEHLASDPFFKKFKRLNEKLVELIEDYSLVSFVPLNVQVSDFMVLVSEVMNSFAGVQKITILAKHWK